MAFAYDSALGDCLLGLAKVPNVGENKAGNALVLLIDAESAGCSRLHLNSRASEPRDLLAQISVRDEVNATVTHRDAEHLHDQALPTEQLDDLRIEFHLMPPPKTVYAVCLRPLSKCNRPFPHSASSVPPLAFLLFPRHAI